MQQISMSTSMSDVMFNLYCFDLRQKYVYEGTSVYLAFE